MIASIARATALPWVLAAALGMVAALAAAAAPATDDGLPAAEAAITQIDHSPGTGLLWRVRRGGDEFYLLGSIHVLRAADLPLPTPVLDACAAADALVMELDLASAAPGELERKLQSYGTADDASLSATLGDAWPDVRRALQEMGINPLAVDGFDPWFLATVLLNQTLAELGFKGELGVESQLTAQARRDGLPVAGLETIDEQLLIFERLSTAAQIDMLEETFDELPQLGQVTARTIEAWRTADTQVLHRELLAPMKDQPEIYDAIVVRRNVRWQAQLLEMLDTAPVELVVVGSLHLLGDDGLVALLAQNPELTLTRLW